ncbi:hypothetical protein ROHU_025543 [Labeo rohita]|uniref:Uncharacterized protein n=1 Tax=Labeo rohita TaxID=84645 RepID=A0A498MHS0_LABRO|nr:hypothetical protein ROHU_025543 [Labeo rohita]
MTLRVRQWRKRKRELDQLLCYSDSDEEGIENNSNSVPGTSSCSSDGVPRTPDSLSDSVLGASDDFDFDTDLDYSSTDSEQEPNEAEVTSFEDELRQWALEHRLTHRALNGLLPILRNQGHLLPVDCRTLLATPQHNTTESKCGGEYKYYGLEKGICRYLSQMETNDVHLNINVNGIPLFKSSGVQFWPILAKCGHFDPFIVAMFSGQSVKLPPFPTAPQKLQPIEDTNMLHTCDTSLEDGAMSGPAECADSPRGSEMSTPNSASQTLDGLVEACSGTEKYAARYRRKEMSNASTALRSRDLSTPRSRHAKDGYRSRSSSGSTIRSWHSDFERPTFRSRDDGSRHSDGPDMMGHSRGQGQDMIDPVAMPPVPRPGPDMIKEHSNVMTDPVAMPPVPRPGPDMIKEHSNVMTDPVAMPPVPRPGPDMIKEHSNVMTDPVAMPPVPRPGPDMIKEHSNVMTDPVAMPPVPRPGPDMIKEHSNVMTDPVAMPPVPRPGPDMIKEHSNVMTDPVAMPPVPRPGPDMIKEHSNVMTDPVAMPPVPRPARHMALKNAQWTHAEVPNHQVATHYQDVEDFPPAPKNILG